MKNPIISLIVLMTLFNGACTKEWLDVKPNKSLVVPTTAQDFQSLLDNPEYFNLNHAGSLGEISTDNCYLIETSWQSSNTAQERNAFIWGETADFYDGERNGDWLNGYRRILHANLVIDGIARITDRKSDSDLMDNVRGSALFLRSYDFFNLLQLFSERYNGETAHLDVGIPLKLSHNVNGTTTRSTVGETYAQIISDVKTAISLLPEHPTAKTRPSRIAAYGFLARVYLTMEDYQRAVHYAELYLDKQNYLLDYNDVNVAAFFPFQAMNEEVVFHAGLTNYSALQRSRIPEENSLYTEYASGDLRKIGFFRPSPTGYVFKGSYAGSALNFCGVATDEIVLVRAECMARLGDIDGAMRVLNDFYRTRWDENMEFVPYTARNEQEALEAVIAERRKQLCYRGIRWADLRRLNRDSRFKTTLHRELGQQIYSLAPESLRWVLPIDEQEIQMSGIQQNNRGGAR